MCSEAEPDINETQKNPKVQYDIKKRLKEKTEERCGIDNCRSEFRHKIVVAFIDDDSLTSSTRVVSSYSFH